MVLRYVYCVVVWFVYRVRILRPTCWPTFGTTSLTNNVGQHVGAVCYGRKHVSEEKNPQKVLANIY